MTTAAARIAALDPPWRDGRPPLYARIVAAIAARAGADRPLAIDIPAAGAQAVSPAQARIIVAALNRVVRHPDAEAAAHAYALLAQAPAADIVDQVLPRIAEESAAHRPAIAALARRLAREAPDAAPVQIAIALIGVFGDAVDEDLIATLGQAEPLTLFAAVALGNLVEEADAAIWRLAQNVHGWGRIEAVGRLQHTDDPAIQDWLLREGFRNAIADAHLAAVCARAGGLRERLAAPRLDPALLGDIADLLRALAHESADEHLGSLEEGPALCAAYLAHVASLPARDLRHVLTCRVLAGLAGDPRLAGWPAAERFALRTKASAELSRPAWRDLIAASPNDPRASAAAAALGVGA